MFGKIIKNCTHTIYWYLTPRKILYIVLSVYFFRQGRTPADKKIFFIQQNMLLVACYLAILL